MATPFVQYHQPGFSMTAADGIMCMGADQEDSKRHLFYAPGLGVFSQPVSCVGEALAHLSGCAAAVVYPYAIGIYVYSHGIIWMVNVHPSAGGQFALAPITRAHTLESCVAMRVPWVAGVTARGDATRVLHTLHLWKVTLPASDAVTEKLAAELAWSQRLETGPTTVAVNGSGEVLVGLDDARLQLWSAGGTRTSEVQTKGSLRALVVASDGMVIYTTARGIFCADGRLSKPPRQLWPDGATWTCATPSGIAAVLHGGEQAVLLGTDGRPALVLDVRWRPALRGNYQLACYADTLVLHCDQPGCDLSVSLCQSSTLVLVMAARRRRLRLPAELMLEIHRTAIVTA